MSQFLDVFLPTSYDTTWSYGIMKDDIGLRGRLSNFISNFFLERSFDVRIGSRLSDTRTGHPAREYLISYFIKYQT